MAAPSAIDDYRWLVSEDAKRWLFQAADDGIPLHQKAARLRKSLSAVRAHLVLQQVELRRRARGKFRHADRLFLTPRGFAQATDQWIACYKARRFPADTIVADLCCGIGGDTMGLTERGAVVAYERDPVSALFAAENVRQHPGRRSASAHVAAEDVLHVEPEGWGAWHIDPDRRQDERRTVNPERMSPPWKYIERLLSKNADAAVKLAPATSPPSECHACAELEWISRGRECRQLVAWFGRLAESPGRRRATILGDDGSVAGQTVARPQPFPPPATSVLDYVCEPDPAVLAAGLAGHIAHSHGLLPLATDIPYFTSQQPPRDAALSCFRVDAVLPFDEKRLAGALRGAGVGRLEIKHRGVPLEPEALRRKFKLAGDGAAVLIVTPHNRRTVAIVASRMPPVPPALANPAQG